MNHEKIAAQPIILNTAEGRKIFLRKSGLYNVLVRTFFACLATDAYLRKQENFLRKYRLFNQNGYK